MNFFKRACKEIKNLVSNYFIWFKRVLMSFSWFWKQLNYCKCPARWIFNIKSVSLPQIFSWQIRILFNWSSTVITSSPFSDFSPANYPDPSANDIALIKQATRLTFNSFLQWAYVTRLPNPSVGTSLTAAGWGITNLEAFPSRSSLWVFYFHTIIEVRHTRSWQLILVPMFAVHVLKKI